MKNTNEINNTEITTQELEAKMDSLWIEKIANKVIPDSVWDSIDGVVKVPEVKDYVQELSYEDMCFWRAYLNFKYGSPTWEDIEILEDAYKTGYTVSLD